MGKSVGVRGAGCVGRCKCTSCWVRRVGGGVGCVGSIAVWGVRVLYPGVGVVVGKSYPSNGASESDLASPRTRMVHRDRRTMSQQATLKLP